MIVFVSSSMNVYIVFLTPIMQLRVLPTRHIVFGNIKIIIAFPLIKQYHICNYN